MSIVDALDRACGRFDEIRASLRWADFAKSTLGHAENRAGDELRAASFVAVMGAVEQYFREFVDWINEQIGSSGVHHSQIRLALHSIAAADDFRSLQDLRDVEKVFNKRALLLERTADATPCVLSPRYDEMGLAGETIRPKQVGYIWRVYGLPGSGFGDVHQQLALRVFADNRNDYAHGKVELADFLQNPECDIKSILRRIDDIEDWLFYCWDAGSDYLSNSSFYR